MAGESWNYFLQWTCSFLEYSSKISFSQLQNWMILLFYRRKVEILKWWSYLVWIVPHLYQFTTMLFCFLCIQKHTQKKKHNSLQPVLIIKKNRYHPNQKAFDFILDNLGTKFASQHLPGPNGESCLPFAIQAASMALVCLFSFLFYSIFFLIYNSNRELLEEEFWFSIRHSQLEVWDL